jgi:hypothetical protein
MSSLYRQILQASEISEQEKKNVQKVEGKWNMAERYKE